MKRFCLSLGLAFSLSACSGGGSAASLAAPSPSPVAPAATSSHTVAGVVSSPLPGTGTPVEGVLVEESISQQRTITDASGTFSFSDVSGPLRLSVSRSGYFSETFTLPAGATYVLLPIAAIPATYTLSGVVFEITEGGHTAVEGVAISGSGCVRSHCQEQSATTDENGRYSLSLFAGENSLWVTKEGYDGPPTTPGCDYCNATATLKGDTRLDIELVRR